MISRPSHRVHRHHVDGATQQLLQLQLDGNKIEKARAGKELDQEIDVGIGTGLTTGDGAEDEDLPRALVSPDDLTDG